jgi:triacylglycerol lipase
MKTYILDGIWGWHSRWEGLRHRIEASLGTCEIWRYDNSGRTSLEVVGTRLREELASTTQPINLVGYSMGGLVIREALRGAGELPVRRAAFLHCPHRGSLAAHTLSLPACREMRPGSAFLKRLDESPWSIPSLATWCALDAVILPGVSGRWERATTVLQSHVPAHAWPVLSPGLHRAVIDFLGKEIPSEKAAEVPL